MIMNQSRISYGNLLRKIDVKYYFQGFTNEFLSCRNFPHATSNQRRRSLLKSITKLFKCSHGYMNCPGFSIFLKLILSQYFAGSLGNLTQFQCIYTIFPRFFTGSQLDPLEPSPSPSASPIPGAIIMMTKETHKVEFDMSDSICDDVVLAMSASPRQFAPSHG